MNEINANPVVISAAEYRELCAARAAIDLIGLSLGRYGADDKLVVNVCKMFGHDKDQMKEAADA